MEISVTVQMNKENWIICVLRYLECEVMVLLLFFGSKSIPPLSQNLADSAVVLIRVPLVNESAMALTEDHEGIHWPPDMILLPLDSPRGERDKSRKDNSTRYT